MSYDDPRLAVVYDTDNPAGEDHEFFRALAARQAARRISDLGCGTGILAVTMAGDGREVIGIDPSAAMLARAAERPGGDAVRWVQGTSSVLGTGSADLVIMSGNVAMHILGDDWHATLRDIAGALVPGGLLAFESRNPQARAWREWNDPGSERETPVGRLRESLTTDPPDADGIVVMHQRSEFPDDGDRIDAEQRLQFRDHAEILRDLADAGLRVTDTYRNWTGDPFTGSADERLMVFVAERE